MAGRDDMGLESQLPALNGVPLVLLCIVKSLVVTLNASLSILCTQPSVKPKKPSFNFSERKAT